MALLELTMWAAYVAALFKLLPITVTNQMQKRRVR
jgi:hypothetical protein